MVVPALDRHEGCGHRLRRRGDLAERRGFQRARQSAVGHRQGAGARRRRRQGVGIARDPGISRRDVSAGTALAGRSRGAGARPCHRRGNARGLRAVAPASAHEHVAPGHAARASRRVQANVRRIEAMWTDCRTRFGAGGAFLFGAFGAADAMYAPVVSRFHTYAVEVGPPPAPIWTR